MRFMKFLEVEIRLECEWDWPTFLSAVSALAADQIVLVSGKALAAGTREATGG